MSSNEDTIRGLIQQLDSAKTFHESFKSWLADYIGWERKEGDTVLDVGRALDDWKRRRSSWDCVPLPEGERVIGMIECKGELILALQHGVFVKRGDVFHQLQIVPAP